ncbi:MAG: DUF488 family protein [Actinobacteria bacterium]|nr:MAG: DUF488 family protein [Actinomycetota bacterium]
MIRTKSAYEPRSADDGYRVLIEPVWPRGLPKGKNTGCDWMKSLYPSMNLRDWMRRNPRKFDSFRGKYLAELSRNEAAVEKLRKMHKQDGTVTLLTVEDGGWDIYGVLAQYLSATCE